MSKRLSEGSIIAPQELQTAHGAPCSLPAKECITHIQFRRFAGCPVCNFHLHTFIRRREEIAQARIREVVVFHSSNESILQYTDEIPFDVIADPDKKLYEQFGVESSPESIRNPKAWWPIFKSAVFTVLNIVLQGKKTPPMQPEGGRYGLPADFLIAPDGQVIACKYGEHVYDQWSVDEMLALAGKA